MSKLCWQRWFHLYQTVSALMLGTETTRLEKFMHEHKLKWFSVSSNIILRRHEGFIEKKFRRNITFCKKSWKTNFHLDLSKTSVTSLSLKIYINRIFRLRVYDHTLFIRSHVQINIVLGGAALCQISFCNSGRQRQITRERHRELGLFYGNVNWCDEKRGLWHKYNTSHLCSRSLTKTIRCAA